MRQIQRVRLHCSGETRGGSFFSFQGILTMGYLLYGLLPATISFQEPEIDCKDIFLLEFYKILIACLIL
jgi:hypothetical protein